MIRPSVLRPLGQAARCRTATPATRRPSAFSIKNKGVPLSASRFLNSSARLGEPDHESATTAASHGESGDHEGRFARTDEGVRIEHPEEEHYPPSQPVQGRGGSHNMRTLASYSLEGKVGVVTGGARGLGLVMSQALVISGANLAIVDVNSTCQSTFENPCLQSTYISPGDEAERQARLLEDTFRTENPSETA